MAKAITNEVKPSIFPSLRFRRLNAQRQEMPDPTPMAPPIGYKKQPSMAELVRDVVKKALTEYAQENGMETFEEADDFDIEDDPLDPHSKYEADFEGDAAAAIRDPDPLEKQYGSVEEFLRENPEIAARIAPSQQLRPEPAPYVPQGGAGEDLAIAPGGAPPLTPSASEGEPRMSSFRTSPLGFLRRG